MQNLATGPGGIVNFPPGSYCVKTGLVINGSGIVLQGADRQNTRILDCTNANILVVSISSNVVYAGIHDMAVIGTQTLPATHAAIENSGGGTDIARVITQGGLYGLYNHGYDSRIDYSSFTLAFGTANLYSDNGALYINRVSVDQSWPGLAPSGASISARMNTTSYVPGSLVSVTSNGISYVLEAFAGATSAAISSPGSGGSNGSCVVQVTGGSPTVPPQLNITITGGAISAINSVASFRCV